MRVGLTEQELELIRSTCRQVAGDTRVVLFGSRAMGTHRNNSDIDLALDGDVSPLQAERLAAELNELPLPYRFDVLALRSVTNTDLAAHITRVGVDV